MTDHEKEFVDQLLDIGLARYSAVEPPAGLEHRLLTALRAGPMSEESADELLEAGLARYSAAEPRSGFEQRILAGLRSAPQPSRWLDWRWAGALATAAGALVIVIFFFARQPEAPAPHPNAPTPQRALHGPDGRLGAGPPQVAPVQPPTTVKGTARRAPARVEQTQAEMPRLETFPAPAPLSEQERLLLLFTLQDPQEAALLARARSRPTESLGAPLLPPLEPIWIENKEGNN